MEYIGIIPARYGSSRLPGKPLCDINGKPMIWHVYNSVKKWNNWKKVYVALDDKRIANVCEKYNIDYVYTDPNHPDCIDRAAETAKILKHRAENADRYIIIQGDEPFFNVDTLNVDLSNEITNFYTEVKDAEEIFDPNCVKVVISNSGKAIYFSRYSIPFRDEKTRRKNLKEKVYKQLGVYSFDYDSLQRYVKLEPTYLENMEGIGLLRLLENDIEVSMKYTDHDSKSVDTEEDRLSLVEKK